MSKDKIYVEGFRTFPKHDKSPDFVLGTLIITPNQLVKWLKENPTLLTEYNGEKQLKCQILNGNKGIYFVVDTYKKDETKPVSKVVVKDDGDSDLPF